MKCILLVIIIIWFYTGTEVAIHDNCLELAKFSENCKDELQSPAVETQDEDTLQDIPGKYICL